MPWKLRSAPGFGLVLLALAICPASASGDGLPVTSTAGYSGVTNPAGDLLYATVQLERGTMVLRIETDSGKLDRSRDMRRPVAVPVVAFDGTASGLSADGRTLLLMRPQTRPRPDTTTFAVLDPESLGRQQEVTLDGYFSFDAISSDGRVVYLIRYTDPPDLTAYEIGRASCRERV